MADPRLSQNAARLSEDIGDVLTAIRRMIADDDALSSARDRIRADRNDLVQDDAGEFLARRYGGNAALARKLVESAGRPAPAPLAAVPAVKAPAAPAPMAPAPAPASAAEPAEAPAIPTFILRARPELVPAANVSPLRLEPERRVEEPEAPKVSGWRAWLRPETREPAPRTEPAPVAAKAVVHDSAEEDDFAEAFDWKARMRPELDEPAPMTLAKSAEQRLSGWALPPEPMAGDTVARLAAEAEAFDAAMQAQTEVKDEEQSIRDLLRDMVQEELNGELGQRFSANLRAVIRREVAAAIDAQLDRF